MMTLSLIVSSVRARRPPAPRPPGAAQAGVLAQLGEGDLGVVLGVAVADDHRDVLADPFGAERGLPEVRRHAEEVDDPFLPARQDRAHLRALDVHAVEDDVVLAAAVGGEDRVEELDRLRRVGHDDGVAEVELLERRHGGLAVDVPDDVSRRPDALHRLVGDEHPALAAGAEDEDALAGPDELGGLRGRARHVERSEREPLVHVGRELGVDAALEEDGLRLDLDAVDLGVDPDDPLDLQRRHAEGDEARDLVARLQVAARESLPDLVDGADEHPAGAGDGVLHLPALADDGEDLRPDLLDVSSRLLLELREARGIDVQVLDVDEDLVVLDLREVVVELLGGLREHALRLEDAVRAVLAGHVGYLSAIAFQDSPGRERPTRWRPSRPVSGRGADR
jgi:hypothetical protein